MAAQLVRNMGTVAQRRKGFSVTALHAKFIATPEPTRIGALMNRSSKMNLTEVLRVRLGVLRHEHRDLDDAIRALEATGTADAFTLKRLKKQKLTLKDKIAQIEDQLTPDIIA